MKRTLNLAASNFIRLALANVVVALLLAIPTPVFAEIVISGGGIQLVEQGGGFAAGNLAPAATLAATPSLPNPSHNIPNLTDLTYGNSDSWIADATNSNGDRFAGISFGATPTTVRSFAFGRDNGGEATMFTDRTFGPYTLQYTQVANPHSNLNLADNADPTVGWADIGTINYASTGVHPLFTSPSLRHRFDFLPVSATGLRVTAIAGIAIDEIEAYSAALVPYPELSVNSPVIIDESTNASGLVFSGAPIPAEPAPGDGEYNHANGPGEFQFRPLIYGDDVKVETSWGVSFNHSKDVDFFFDPDGAGPLAEISLLQDVDQTLFADQTTAIGVGVVDWSGFLTIADGLDITPESVFRVTGTNAANGTAPQALNSAAWRFTAAPEPTSVAVWCLLGLVGVGFWIKRRRG